MQSEAPTVQAYLAELEPDRSKGVHTLLELVRENIDSGFHETMRWGMISFEVPLEVTGPTYNKQPLNYLAIASQKHHYSFYMSGIYADSEKHEEFQARWREGGLKLDMGKSCVRFRTIQQANLEALAWAARQYTVTSYLDLVASVRP